MGVKQLCGDLSNAYVNSDTSHKVYVPVARPKFGSQSGKIIVIKCALYWLSASGSYWYRNLLTTLRHIGLDPTRFDRDAWIKMAESVDHYEYICTYVYYLMIASKAPEDVMELMKK